MKSHLLILSLIILFSISIHDSFAYIEPGSASMILQAILGGLIGVGVALKVYWYKIKEKFFRK